MYGIFLDIETTGLNFEIHKAIEIGFKIVDLSTGLIMAGYESVVQQPPEVWDKKDNESIKINGFTWEKLLTGKFPSRVREEIIEIFTEFSVSRKNFFYLCQNPSFDRTFFAQIVDVETQEKKRWPYHWLDLASMYWVLQVKHFQNNQLPLPVDINLSKNSIAKHYGLPSETFPHGALNGVNHLMLCYEKVVGFSSH